MELYQCKLMVLHAAYKIDRGDDFRTEVSMAKHFVANSLNRIIDRAIQVHGALGYSTDTPLASMLQHARWARFADGADEIHQMRIAERTIAAYQDSGSTAPPPAGCPCSCGPDALARRGQRAMAGWRSSHGRATSSCEANRNSRSSRP